MQNLNVMELTRIIHPVGQGGFYTETLKSDSDEINVIFDCGGNNKTSMEYYLENYYPKKTKTIDAVFISHLHADHINGLQYLLNNCSVRYLFLPQLTIDERLEVLLYNDLKSESDTSGVYSFLNELLNTNNFYRETRIVRVLHYNRDDHASDEAIEDRDLDIVKEIGVNSIKSGTKIHFGKEWLLIPYNPPIIKKKQGFYDYFKKQLTINNFNFMDLPEIVKEKGPDRCKEIYNKYFEGNHNSYSMALFSGIAKSHTYFNYCDSCFNVMLKHCHCCHHCHPLRQMYRNKYSLFCSPNCLYTGDFDIKNQFNGMKLFYDQFWKTIGSIQVPHHGSRNNYCPDLYEYANRAFISFGERNRFHHPNVDTLIGIQEKGCDPIMVTERISTLKMYHYSI